MKRNTFSAILLTLVLSCASTETRTGQGATDTAQNPSLWDTVSGWFSSTFKRGEPSAEDIAFEHAEQDERRHAWINRTLASRDITLGMDRSQVQQAWGSPRDVSYAGDPRSGNERWMYTLSVSSSWGLGPRKVVYFEGGKVVGWETENGN